MGQGDKSQTEKDLLEEGQRGDQRLRKKKK